MGKHKWLIIILIVILLSTFDMHLIMQAHASSAWSIQTVDSTSVVMNKSSIKLDSNNKPHISYSGYLNGDRGNSSLMYAMWTGSNWTIQVVDSNGSVGFGSSIALDPSNNPHISYFDSTNERLKYAKWTGSEWYIQTVDSSVGGWASLAIDSNGSPHIAYSGKNQVLMYASWISSTWITQSVDSEGRVGGISLALDPDNNPHISYYIDTTDGDNSPLQVKYARKGGSTWSIQTIDSVIASAWGSSIAIDSMGDVHISYTDHSLKYAKWNGMTWNIQTIDSNFVDYPTSIALDSNDYPHISYTVSFSTLMYAMWMGSNWNIQTVDSTPTVWPGSSLALDTGNTPHISYFISPYGGRSGYLKYAVLEKSVPPNSTPPLDSTLLIIIIVATGIVVIIATMIFVCRVCRKRKQAPTLT
jgi:hypothetical protein